MQDDIQHDADGANMVDEAADGSEQERKKSGGGADEAGAAASVALPRHAGSSSAIVSVYHDGECLKLLDTVEFFGVLSVASLDSTLAGRR